MYLNLKPPLTTKKKNKSMPLSYKFLDFICKYK